MLSPEHMLPVVHIAMKDDCIAHTATGNQMVTRTCTPPRPPPQFMQISTKLLQTLAKIQVHNVQSACQVTHSKLSY